LDVCNQLQQQQQISNTKDWLQLNFYPHPWESPVFMITTNGQLTWLGCNHMNRMDSENGEKWEGDNLANLLDC
jgi:hypothetical protein